MSQPKKVIVAYGFEYDALIGYPPRGVILCKCFETQYPFYAADVYIESTSIDVITEKIKEIEESQQELLEKIKYLAKYRCIFDRDEPCNPQWRTVIYYDNIKFNNLEINYESEGDENGDGR